MSFSIPGAALFCYGFLLLTLLPAKKSRIVNAFLLVMVASILWTGGSMFMRLLLFPGIGFWFQVSIIGMFLLPLAFYQFIQEFLEQKSFWRKNLFRLGTIAIIFINLWGVFIAPPTLTWSDGGSPLFLYEFQWPVFVATAFLVLIVLSILSMILREMRRNELTASRLSPILAGVLLLFIGNLANLIPGVSSTSFDTLSGAIAAILFFYALYRRRLFTLTLLASRGTTYVVATTSVAMVFAWFIGPMEQLINTSFYQLQPYKSLVIAIAFTLVVLLVYWLIKRVFDHLFLKEEVLQGELLRKFSIQVSKSLRLDEILSLLGDIIHQGVEASKVLVCLPDPTGTYRSVYGSNPLDPRDFSFGPDNPLVTQLESADDCLLIRDFHRSPLYKSMWEKEKDQINAWKTDCVVPLHSDNQLAGFVLLSAKEKKGHYSLDDLNFLESAAGIVSIAIKNAHLYEKAYQEARTDDLTGLLNRKYFFHTLHEEMSRPQNDCVTLLLLNIDDFKLYNQLYGTAEGDLALGRIADLIKSSIGNKGIPARYSGKEFAVILPNYDVLATSLLAESIRGKVAVMHKNDENEAFKTLTFSAGICTYPYGATNAKELVENVEMTVFNVKRGGKNKVEVYSLKDPDAIIQKNHPIIKSEVYQEYASTIYALTAAIDTKDHYTFGHCQKVAEYAVLLGEASRLNDDHIEIIREAALLHDIGKIGIPEDILNKKGFLTDEEFEVMRRHVVNSISIIRHLPSLDYVIPAVTGHHERWDGKGYPRGIAGEAIPLSARVLAIADAFDAMTTKRSYKKALTIEFATNEIIKNAGLQFDPSLALMFAELVNQGKIQVD